MEDEIAALTSEQALRAIEVFYALLPPEMWRDQAKPSMARGEVLAARLQENAPGDTKPFVTLLIAQGNIEGKGEVAKTFLSLFARQEALRHYVKQSIAQSKEPRMMDPISLSIGAVLVLALLSQDVDAGKLHTKTHVPEMLEQLAKVLKALPQGIWGKFK